MRKREHSPVDVCVCALYGMMTLKSGMPTMSLKMSFDCVCFEHVDISHRLKASPI